MSGQQITASGPLNANKRARALLDKLGRDPLSAPVEALVEVLSATNPIMGGGLNFEQAMHTGDIGLVFGTKPDMTPAQAAMGERMMATFVRFAKTGNPGWGAYDLVTRKTMIFDTASHVENNPRARERELFGVVPYVQPGT